MGVDTIASQTTKTPAASSSLPSRADNNASTPSEAEFNRLFEEAMKRTTSSSVGDGDSNDAPKMHMSQDEQKKFLSAMQNPEFRSLLNEYMTEISDPANRAETEQYLSQLENEQRVPSDKILVRPAPGFVVKAKWQEDAGSQEQRKIFLNVCSSEKMQPPSSTPVTTDAMGKRGTSWQLPYSVGPERLEKDKSGAMVLTFDVCFHPTTLGFAKTHKSYRDMVVKTGLDAIENLLRDSRKKPTVVVAREYHVLKGVSYKSGDPVTMCLRNPATEKPGAANDSVKSKQETKSEVVAQKSATAPPSSDATKEKPIDVVARKNASKALRIGADDDADKDVAELMKEVSSTKKATLTQTKSSAPALKRVAFKLIYRGNFELLHHMQAEHENIAPVERNRPKELVVEMEFPMLASAAGIDLDVSEHALKLTTKGYEPLEIKLPFSVLEAKGSAKFDKKERKLIVTLPVQPPPEPKPKSVTLVVEEEEEEEEEHVKEAKMDNKDAAISQFERQKAPAAPEITAKPREDDRFAMLRETAMMVQHDPQYLLRQQQQQSPPSPASDVTRATCVESNVDLPPLGRRSEEEDAEKEQDEEDDDLVLVEPPALHEHVEQQPVSATTPPSKAAPYTIKETSTCLSFIIDVAGIDPSSVDLTFPSSNALNLRFAVKSNRHRSEEEIERVERFELKLDALEHACVPSDAEFDVASENMVVVLRKAARDESAPALLSGAVCLDPLSSASSGASIAPVVRFQNQLLYELD